MDVLKTKDIILQIFYFTIDKRFFINNVRYENLKELYNYYRVCKYWKTFVKDFIMMFVSGKSSYTSRYIYNPFFIIGGKKFITKTYDSSNTLIFNTISDIELYRYYPMTDHYMLKLFYFTIRKDITESIIDFEQGKSEYEYHCSKCSIMFSLQKKLNGEQLCLSKSCSIVKLGQSSTLIMEISNLEQKFCMKNSMDNIGKESYYFLFEKESPRNFFSELEYEAIKNYLQYKICDSKEMQTRIIQRTHNSEVIKNDKNIQWETFKISQ